MADTSVVYTGDGAQETFNVPFRYILKSHVKVSVNAVVQMNPSDYVWDNATTINFVVAPAVNDAIDIRRLTPGDTRIVDFQNGAVLTEQDLDAAIDQVFFMAQEAKENYSALLNGELIRLGTPNGILTTDPELWFDSAVDTMLATAAAAALQAAVTDIATNAESIISNADLLQLLGDATGPRTAFILDETTVEVDGGGTTLAQKFSTMIASTATNAAAIVTEQGVRAAADSAIAFDITLLGVANGADTAFILNTATVRIDGEAGDPLSTVLARQGVLLDVNGYVTGYEQLNDGTTGSFTIKADEFKIVEGAGPSEVGDVVFSVSGGVTTMQNVTIQGNLIVDGTINGAHIAADSILASHIAAGEVGLSEFDSALRPVQIVTSLPTLPHATYPVNAIVVLTTDSKLYRNAADVWTAAVPTADLVGTIDTAQITADAIDATLIADNAIETPHLSANVVTAAEIFANTITAAEIAANTITAAEIFANTITAAEIAANTITAAEIFANTITAGQIAAGTITTAEIKAGTIVAANISGTNLAAIYADLGSITAGNITLNTSGYIKGGQTAYDTGNGFWLGYDSTAWKFSLGDSAGENLTWDGSALAITGNIDMTNSVSTFTPTWTGFSTDPSGDISYIDFGAFVMMYVTAANLGTSNLATFTLSGVPSAIRPVTGGRWSVSIISDDNTAECGTSHIDSAGVITFHKVQLAVSGNDILPLSGKFKTSGQKGLPAGWMIQYPK